MTSVSEQQRPAPPTTNTNANTNTNTNTTDTLKSPDEATTITTTTTNPTNNNTNNNNKPDMVAGFFHPSATTTGTTPPASPLRNNHQFVQLSTTTNNNNTNGATSKQSPKNNNRRATYNAESPRRTSMVNPINNANSSNTNSPLPPISGRLQPATAQAPVVGHHHKRGNSLVGFDPLLATVGPIMSSSSPQPTNGNGNGNGSIQFSTPVTPNSNHYNNSNNHNMATLAAMANLKTNPNLAPPPLSPPRNANNATTTMTTGNYSPNNGNPDLEKELQKLAKQVVTAASATTSPQQQPSSSAKSKVSKPKFGRAGSITQKFGQLTPPFRSTTSTAAAAAASDSNVVKEPLSVPSSRKSKLPWQKLGSKRMGGSHRRTRSLEMPDGQAADIMAAIGNGIGMIATTASFEQPDSGTFGRNNKNMTGNDPMALPSLLHDPNNRNAAATTGTTGTNRGFSKRASTGGTMIPNINMVPASPMMQDLYDVVKAQNQQQLKNSGGNGGGAGDPMSASAKSIALPSLAKPAPTSFLTGTEIVRSSEQDPSPFQMEIPTLQQTLVHARLVQFVEHYRKEDMNMDLNMSLVGLTRSRMQAFCLNTDSAGPPNLTDVHRPVVESLLEAAEDVTVLGYFEATPADNAGSADGRREAVLLERQMQIVVVFRGTTPEQTAKTPFFKKNHNHKHNAMEALEVVAVASSNGNDASTAADSSAKIYTTVKQAYMELEARVFACLDKYMDENPFCDVVFTGQSMGGALATLAAYRYSTNRPVVRVSCQTFGCPKVGNRAFRQQANTLPNLKVMRIENVNDQKCLAPDANMGAHVGHSIVLSKTSDSGGLSAAAFKFDDDHDARKQRSSKPNILAAAFKKERDIASYVSTLEQLNNQVAKNRWPVDFKGEDGTGVRGKDNEQRRMV